MTLEVLRRRTLLRPTPVTTGHAPTLAPVDEHVDIVVPDPSPRHDMPHHPPGYTSGVCWHPAHVVLDGRRYGVTPEGRDREPSRAALTRCHHYTAQGR